VESVQLCREAILESTVFAFGKSPVFVEWVEVGANGAGEEDGFLGRGRFTRFAECLGYFTAEVIDTIN